MRSKTLLRCLAILVPVALVAPVAAQGVHALDGTHEILAQNYQGRVLWIEYQNRGGTTQWATAVRINDRFALTAAHVAWVFDPATTPIVGDGSNALTSQGNTRNIVDWGWHPTWTGTFDGTAVDVAWLEFDSPLPGPVPAELIRATPLGDLITVVGFGRPGTPGGGLLAHDRERRAIEVVHDANGNGGLQISTDYAEGIFLTLAQRNLPFAGVITPGNSGSPGWDPDGNLVTIANAQAGAPSYGSASYMFRLVRERTWIESVTNPCPPDLNGDGILDNGDISTFVTLFLGGDLQADFNGDGILDNGDISEFVSQFLAGC